MNKWRCAICKETGEAPDKRSAEIALGNHWKQFHFGRGSGPARSADSASAHQTRAEQSTPIGSTSRRTNADRDPDD